MDDFENLSVKIKYYKCFGETEQGFEKIKPLNIIIGKNNSGKTSLLEVLNFLCKNKQPDEEFKSLSNKNIEKNPYIELSYKLNKNDVNIFVNERHNMKSELYNNNNLVFAQEFYEHKKLFCGIEYLRTSSASNSFNYLTKYLKIENIPDYAISETNMLFDNNNKLNYVNLFSQKQFFRINSDRDITVENTSNSLDILSNGKGCTNSFQRFINLHSLPTEMITSNIFNDLNRIYEPEIKFTEIRTIINDNDEWEIYLSDSKKKEIPLSNCGSGLKTVLLVLAFIHIIPFVNKVDLSKIVFAFEELENNLHPSLQRKLFSYLREIAINKKALFFITTHSNVVIDLFSKDVSAQIIHITNNGKDSEVVSALTYDKQKFILDDLDIRASDILQSNCVVWVEGPSDRIYFNKWIELFSNNELKEGHHYQCVFYGGRLLYHLSANDPESNENLIKILSINRNPIMLMDSDKKKKKEKINETKLRVKDEIDKKEGIAWITQGKEIENYIPKEALQRYYEKNNIHQIYKYEIFHNYLNRIKKGEGRKFLNNKVTFANDIQKYFKLEDLRSVLDLNEKMIEIVNKIKKWNNIK